MNDIMRWFFPANYLPNDQSNLELLLVPMCSNKSIFENMVQDSLDEVLDTDEVETSTEPIDFDTLRDHFSGYTMDIKARPCYALSNGALNVEETRVNPSPICFCVRNMVDQIFGTDRLDYMSTNFAEWAEECATTSDFFKGQFSKYEVVIPLRVRVSTPLIDKFQPFGGLPLEKVTKRYIFCVGIRQRYYKRAGLKFLMRVLCCVAKRKS